MTDTVETQGHDRFTTLVAIMIALVTVIGAVVAWRASVAEDASGDADYAGLRAAINAEETRAINAATAYAQYGAYVTYQRNSALGNLIADDMALAATDDELLILNSQRADAHDTAIATERLFQQRFLNRDGTYSVERQMGEMWADAVRERDLNPEPQFAEADRLSDKSSNLLAMVGVLALALVCYTLIEAVDGRLRYVLLAAGTLLALGGTIGAVMLELAV